MTPSEAMREITDPRTLRALAHPRRIDLLDALFVHGPMTASECATRVGDSVPSCSYHLRQLARYGFIEAAPARDGRERPWRVVPRGNRFGRSSATPAERAAVEALHGVVDSRRAATIARLMSELDAWPAAWRDTAISSDYTLRLSLAELSGLRAALDELLMPYQRRAIDGADPSDAQLVRVFQWALPDSQGGVPADA